MKALLYATAALCCLGLLTACGEKTTTGEAPFKGSTKNSIRHSKPDFKQDPQAPAGSPNIVMIVADDLGYSDIAPYGSEIATPNLQALADRGVQFSRFTVTAMCSPSRAALLTGLNHHSAGVGWISEWDFGFPGYRGELHDNIVTLPQILQQHGYATYAAGKWHLSNGEHRSASGPFSSWPTQKGFDRYWGFMEGETDQFQPAYIVNGNEFEPLPNRPDYYFPDELTKRAKQMVTDLRSVNRSKPFFLYYAPGAVHAPHQTLPQDRERYRGLYQQGWDTVRKQRLSRQIERGLLPAATSLSAHNPDVQAWAQLSAEQQQVYARLQENYAGFVDNLDQQIGSLVDYLEEIGELDNTIIIFLSDNGASSEGDVEGQTNGLAYFHYHKTTTAENLPLLDLIGSPETHPHYPLGWAQASNTPFAYTKRTTHGGGIHSPLIISWPQGLAARGELRHQFHHINDIAPTLLEWLGITPPDHYQGRAIKPMEGTSMLYALRDPAAATQKAAQYYELEANRAIIDWPWKLVSYRPLDQHFDDTSWRLYNLEQDPSETLDLSQQHSKLTKQLEKHWWKLARQYDVLPLIDTGLLERALYSKLIRQAPQGELRYPAGAASVPHSLAPLLPGKSFRLSAEITRDSSEQAGVIAAQGDAFSGYSLFIQNNRLHYYVNTGSKTLSLSADSELPEGNVRIGLRFDKDSTVWTVAKKLLSEGINFNRLSVLRGDLYLEVNGQTVAQGRLEQPMLAAWEGFDVGRDSGSSVAPAYRELAPFAFQGKLDEVVIHID